ncbi:MAG: hypothetical protein EA413_08665, partial [Cyanobium sp. PLM2.Bin73]
MHRDWVERRTLVLHVGINKTASTYIQHRLKRNRRFLRRRGLLYPRRRSEHLQLVKALSQGRMDPWTQLLQQARRQGLVPMISAEILSELLHQRRDPGAATTLLADLVAFLASRQMDLHLVAFVRDQPAYLNSRYTQLIKRFYFALPFRRFVRRAMAGTGKGACDYERLFTEALDHPAVTTTFLPFRSGEADPCDRLLAAIGVPDPQALPPLQQLANSQPGWKAVWLAQRLARRLRRHHPEAWRDGATKARLRQALERLAVKREWPAEPYQGVDGESLARLEQHYAASNERFARRVWGCSWRELFPRPQLKTSPTRPRSPQERRQLKALARQLLAETLSAPAAPARRARRRSCAAAAAISAPP